jgi:predicted DNA-binding transcriptional regulator AlpA
MSLSRDGGPLPLPEETERLLSRGEVLQIMGVSYPTLWGLMRSNRFPKPLKIARNRVGWLRSEVLAHLKSLPRQQYK